MEKFFLDDVSVNVLCCMKEGGFDFVCIYFIDFFVIFFSEWEVCQVVGQFCGEFFRVQVVVCDDGFWNLQVSKVMYVIYVVIGVFEYDLEEVVVLLGGVLDGWGVIQEVILLCL